MENNIPPIIADTYKVIGEIGSGGGGIVYLAEHMRLNKKVVLKADKRTLSTKQEILRREVDALKDLSHTYIPQVYDFLAEDGTVYTVMDYIDGESFDKPLKRGESYTQAQVVEWACQLLDALSYLHSRHPHGILHADIKPANIMLTPQGDIRLIDFNIALALGEEGAVAVGRSFGYASPEHYGIDYSSGNVTQLLKTDVETKISADTKSDVETILETKEKSKSSQSTSGSKPIMLDVRSDIYSLGAVLYHIITGNRPERNATEVVKISDKKCSKAVKSIIEKAMNPNPELRYASAAEMLYDFEHLRENDPRTLKFKKKVITTVICLSILFLSGGFTTFVGLKQLEQVQNAYVLAEYSGNALREGNIEMAIVHALEALPEKKDIFTPPHTSRAKKALTDALNVYDLSDGFKSYRTVELPSSPLYMEISPEGKTVTCLYAYQFAVIDTETAEIITTLPAQSSALSEVKYISEDTIICASEDGIKAYNISEDKELWTGKEATAITLSADKKVAAAVYKEEDKAIIYNTENGSIINEIDFKGKHQQITVNDSFVNPKDNLLALNKDGSLLGVSFADGSLYIYNLKNREGDIELFDNTSGYTHFEGGFYEHYFAFSASSSDNSVFAVIDTDKLEQTGGFESEKSFGVQVDESGIYVQIENILVNIHPETGEQTALADTAENIFTFTRSNTHTLITSKDKYMFFDKNCNLITTNNKEYSSDLIKISDNVAIIGSFDVPYLRIMKYENHPQSEVFSYDSNYIHDESRISKDGKTVMMFSYNEFRLYDINGEIITEVSIPNAEQIYDQQYRKNEDDSYLEVIYNDGTIHAYSAQDGSLLYETMGEKPDMSLYEEFYTENLRIESPLHGTPTAYNKDTGNLVAQLEEDAYLTYVTQIGEYIITEYITTESMRYGLLLNNKCETLAYLPYLCDIVDNELIFDYPTGNLRKSRIYHINELLDNARKQINN